MPEQLIAQMHVLYHGSEYKPGDVLPACDLSNAWLESGAGIPVDDYHPPETRVLATPAAAEAGLPGKAVGGEATGEDLMGKVPKTRQRSKK